MGLKRASTPVTEAAAVTAARDCARLEAAFSAFTDITDAVGEDGDLTTLLELVSARACELVGVERCAVYLRDDDETGALRGRLLRVGDSVDDRIKELGCGGEADRFTREILETLAPVVIADTRTDARPVRSTMQRWHVQAMLGVPLVLRGSVLGVLYLDDEGRRHAFSEEDVSVAAVFANLAAIVVAHVRATAELRTTLGTVAKQNAALRRAAVAENRLAELVLDGADFDEIAQSVAELTGKPCAIYGASGRRLGSGPAGCDGRGAALLEPEDCEQPEIAQALAGLRPKTTSVIGPFRTTGFAHRLLISPVAVRGDEWGRIVVMEHRSRLTAFDAHVARRAATIIALEISARRRAAEVHAQGTETLLRDLLEGLGDEEKLARRARFQGVPVDERHVLCLVSDEHGQPWRGPAVEQLVAAVGDRTPVAGARVAEGVVLALRVSADSDPIDAARGLVEDVLGGISRGHRAVAALSSVFTGAGGFARAYHEVRQVAHCLRTFGGGSGGTVLAADDLGAGCLFLASTPRDDADRFVEHTLGALLDEPDRAMADLLATLGAFFSRSRNVRETAEVIGVHENTIRYRLARIAELTGLDVATNADHQLAGQLATLVLRLEGRLPAPASPAPSTDDGGVHTPAGVS